MHNFLFCVVIPIYKTVPTDGELFSIRNTVEKMPDTPIFFIAPKKLEASAYSSFSSVQILRFPDRYFKDLYGYNRLMLSLSFYRRFRNYKYILIVQPDALILRDRMYLEELLDENDYDYWGAPWKDKIVLSNINFFLYRKWLQNFNFLLSFFKKNELICEVGNGGLSLRNVHKTLALLRSRFLEKILWGCNEDAFFAYFGQENRVGFTLAPAGLAGRFSWEGLLHDNLHYEDLPFGIHDWETYFPDIMQYWDTLQKAPDFFNEPFTYTIGDTVSFRTEGFNATPYMLSGFYDTGEAGSWTVDDSAELLFRLDGHKGGHAIRGEITLAGSWTGCKAVLIYINGTFLGIEPVWINRILFKFNCESSVLLLRIGMLTPFTPSSLELGSQRLRLGICMKSLRFTEEFTEEIDEKLYIYGAGKIGRSVLRRMRSLCMEPDACLVADTSRNPASLAGVPVIGLQDAEVSNARVVVAVGRKLQEDVLDALAVRGFTGVELYADFFSRMQG